ncbi:hypothetical protein Tco_1135535 [Tanacetum coccineum]
MAALKVASSHNMVAFLDKPTESEGSEIPTDSHHTPTTTQPSTSKPQKKQSRRKQRKDTEVSQPSGPTEPMTDETENVEVLSQRVLDLEKTKTSQAAKITELKERVKKLEGKRKSKPLGMKRLFKIGRSAQVVSSEDEGLGDQEDASKQGRKIDEINQDAEVTLVDETQGRYGDNLMFDTGVLDNEQDMAGKEVDMAEKDVSTADPVTTVGEVVTTTNVVVSTAEVAADGTTTTTVDELTLAQTLIEIKEAKPKAVTTAATTIRKRLIWLKRMLVLLIQLLLLIGFVVVVDFVVCFGKFVEIQEKLVVEIEEKLPQRGVGVSTWPPTSSSLSDLQYRNVGNGVNAGPHGVTVPRALKIKAAKPKAVTTAATTTTTVVTRPKARGVVAQELSEFTTTTSPSQSSQLPQAKDKGKAKMIEPEKPLKKKDQIMFDKEVAQKLQAQLDAELEEEEKFARQREEDAKIVEWDKSKEN